MIDRKTLYCSFCGKSQHEVKKLIAGPMVFICDGCALLCVIILTDEYKLAEILDAQKIFGNVMLSDLQELQVCSFEELGRLGGAEKTKGPYTALDIFTTTMRGIDALLLASTQPRLEKQIAAFRTLIASEEAEAQKQIELPQARSVTLQGFPTKRLDILRAELARLEALQSTPKVEDL